ncbi:general substrate transporter [Penicillium alfredii]|uniref:General substrate transporter n=1 Tax=Penicillium alfredii TaxID=1506179 RepID=A0A9W9K4I9_9EURO|nr:general substrate transporter [Penicillium alfredii]KAJ5092550.1 general substrate transporter [Penicillium alfredii]
MDPDFETTLSGETKAKLGTIHLEDAANEAIEFSLDSIELTETGYYTWLVSITVGVGGLLFGYDTGIISAVLVVLNDDLAHELNSNEKELITALTSGGAFLGALAAASAFTLVQMSVGRFVIGIGVGSAAMIIPVSSVPMKPKKAGTYFMYRGRMIGLDNMSITGGQLVAYGVGAGLSKVFHGWRYMVGLGAVPALVLGICLHFCPESPRQLICHGRTEEASRVIAKIFPNGTDLQVQQKVQHMKIHVEEARGLAGEGGLWRQLKQLYTVPSNLRALVAACGLMGMQQFTGYNTLMYYSSTLFGIVGFSNLVAVGMIIAGTGFGMAVFLAIAAVGFHWIPVRPNLTLKTTNIGWPVYLVLASMIIFVIFYSLGIGNLAWVSSEFFPLEIRALGTMMMTCTCWRANIVVASTFLTQMENTTPSGTFWFYAVLCAVGWIAIYCCYPEVKGMTLEDIREVFNHGFGVAYARGVQKEQSRRRKVQAEWKDGVAVP